MRPIPWFKVDDNLVGNKKFSRIPRPDRMAATGLWATLGSWCARELTGGFVPDEMVREVGGTAKQARLLVEADLWSRVEHGVDSGFSFNNWHDYQPTRENVEADRLAAKERQQKARDKARQKRVTETSQRDEAVSHATVTDASRRESRHRHGPPDPTRPDPVVPTELHDPLRGSDANASPTPTKAKRAATLPANWDPDPEVIAAMARECPTVDLASEHRKFSDYWHGTGKPMKEWNAVWRNWIRRSANDTKPGPRRNATDIDWEAAAIRAANRDRNSA